jgi:Tfp pilus assembly protein FimV
MTETAAAAAAAGATTTTTTTTTATLAPNPQAFHQQTIQSQLTDNVLVPHIFVAKG